MKILKLIGNMEFIVDDDEAESIAQLFGREQLIKLRCGEIINPKHIIAITSPDVVPYYDGFYRLDNDQRFFVRDGHRIYLEDIAGEKKVEYKPHPKYSAMVKRLAEKMRMMSDKNRTIVQEEVAIEERKLR